MEGFTSDVVADEFGGHSLSDLKCGGPGCLVNAYGLQGRGRDVQNS